MNEPVVRNSVFEKWKAVTNCHRFFHKAMATTFEIFIVNDDRQYAQQAAYAAFNELERLEAELSRFIENSDISQINNLVENQPLKIGIDTFECLKIGKQAFEKTNGAFDFTVGDLMDCWVDEQKQTRIPSHLELDSAREKLGCKSLILDHENYTVMLEKPLKIDLGGIGKGYAVDRMADLLGQWSIDTALISGGSSSIRALSCSPDIDGWPVTLRDPHDKTVISVVSLTDCVLGGSGLQKGLHIIDPRNAEPVKDTLACWVITQDSAAAADALSTAFMVMTPDEIEGYCSAFPGTEALTIANEKGNNIRRIFGGRIFFKTGNNNEGLV